MSSDSLGETNALTSSQVEGFSSNETALATRPTLRSWINEYREIEQDYLDVLRRMGIDFAIRNQHAPQTQLRKRRLKNKGATFRNGGESISIHALSSACIACAADKGSKTFVLSLKCNRNCYFCFNSNQEDRDLLSELKTNWRDEIDEFAARGNEVTHVGLTGGEPLLHKRDAIEFVKYAHNTQPQAHIRLYTAGDFLDDETLKGLRDAGLQELRLSIKIDSVDIDSADDIIDQAVERLVRAKHYLPDVMVEMPVIPGTDDPMRHLLKRLDEIGVYGINLLEFGFPLSDWSEFSRRGFEVKNPPYPILYNYIYAGGLPIDGSELLCLDLIEYAIEEGLSLGVHYCSLENKNRTQIAEQNSMLKLNPQIYSLDGEDFFYKTVKVFDGDVPIAKNRLDSQNKPYKVDEQDGGLLFHPNELSKLKNLDILPALSYNVLEQNGGAYNIRELKLELM